MPFALLEAYAAAMPQVAAEEALQSVHVHALGSGSLRKDDIRKGMRRLERAAGLTAPAAQATPDELAAIGIRVERRP